MTAQQDRDDENPPTKSLNPVVRIMTEFRVSVLKIGVDATVYCVAACVALLGITFGHSPVQSVGSALMLGTGWPLVKFLNSLSDKHKAKIELDKARLEGQRIKLKHIAKQNSRPGGGK
jgi:hypothetical protein